MSSKAQQETINLNEQTQQAICYICAICGKETFLKVGTEVQCQHDNKHKALYKKREERPIVYKCI
ncbi:RNA_polymerase II subunit Rpb12 [Hexamita inflata]|uniref:RNA polymerase II subunit Rpb12 n=1 Tax=Hexamita inflata TaxID=28002 RepID=A0AA86U0C6_9EUKA|nr:RNA polymerase II subunit Rpb12 [Hexamita inflata]